MLMVTDEGETNDLAESHPERLREMVAFWHTYEAETGTVLPDSGMTANGFGRFTGVSWDDWE